MEKFSRIEKIISKIFNHIVVSLFGVMFLLVLFQIIMRYVFNHPSVWSEELVRFLLVWIVFLGSIIVTRGKEHIKIGIFVEFLPVKLKNIFQFIEKILSSLFLLLLIYFGSHIIIQNLHNMSSIININRGFIYLCIPLGAVGMLIYKFKELKEEKNRWK